MQPTSRLKFRRHSVAHVKMAEENDECPTQKLLFDWIRLIKFTVVPIESNFIMSYANASEYIVSTA